MSRFRSTVLLHIITTTGLCLGYVSSILVAKYFGTSSPVAAYYLADLLCIILMVYIEPVKDATVSRLKALEMDDRRAANRSISAAINLFLILSVSLVLFAYLLIDPITRLLVWNSPDLFDQVRHITRYLLPLLIVQPLATLLEGYLYVQKRYYISQISKVIGLIVALGVLVFGQSHWGILAYVAYRVVTFTIQLIGCAFALPAAGFRYSLTLRLAAGRQIARLVAPLILANASMLAVVFLLRQALGQAELAAFGYTEKIWGAFLLIIVAPVSSVIWPDMIASHREAGSKFWEQLHTPLRLLLTALAGIGVLLICLAEPAVMVVFQRGRFDAGSTALTVQCLKIMAASLPFWGLMLICTRGLAVLERTGTVLVVKAGGSLLAGSAILFFMEKFPDVAFASVYVFAGGGAAISLLLARAVFAGAGREHHSTYSLYLARILASAVAVCLVFYWLGLDRRLVVLVDLRGKWVALVALVTATAGLLAVYAGLLVGVGERAVVGYAVVKLKDLLRTLAGRTGR